MKYSILKIMPSSYRNYFYNRVRRMKRWGYTYDSSISVVENLMLFAIRLDGIGKRELAKKELDKMEKILKARRRK